MTQLTDHADHTGEIERDPKSTNVVSLPAIQPLAEIAKADNNVLLDEALLNLDHVPEPLLWRVIVKQVGIKTKIKGQNGFELVLPDKVVSDQEWTHGMCVVVKVGPTVYRGKKFEDMGIDASQDAPRVGEVYAFEARQPKRFKIDGIQLIELADDALTMKFNKDHLDKVSFQVG